MPSTGALLLAAGGVLSAAAAVAHLACIAIGPPAYRFMGAGEKMARAVEAGRLRPIGITLGISLVLLVWAAYALSGAGLIPALPLARPVLAGICAAYLLRAVAFPVLRPVFPGNTARFWHVSSGICLLIGAVHAGGLALQWKML